MIPIVFVYSEIGFHRDAQLAAAVECAHLHSPHTPTVLLQNPESERSKAYQKMFQWLPTSNPMAFEFSSIVRWIYLLDYMEQNNCESVFHCDCDVLIFQDMELEAEGWFRDFDYTITTNPDKRVATCVNGGSSLIRLPVIRSFVDFMFERGGKESQDMALWGAFQESHPQFKCGEMHQIRDGAIYDLTLCGGLPGFELDPLDKGENAWGLKNKLILWKAGKPHFRFVGSQEVVRAKTLHCWAYGKMIMRRLVEESKASMTPDNP